MSEIQPRAELAEGPVYREPHGGFLNVQEDGRAVIHVAEHGRPLPLEYNSAAEAFEAGWRRGRYCISPAGGLIVRGQELGDDEVALGWKHLERSDYVVGVDLNLRLDSNGVAVFEADRPTAFEADLAEVLTELQDVLVSKNRRYGNSALDPVRMFSKATTVEQLLVRIDDKLSRMARGSGDESEDVELDLLGYLVILRIARRRQSEK